MAEYHLFNNRQTPNPEWYEGSHAWPEYQGTAVDRLAVLTKRYVDGTDFYEYGLADSPAQFMQTPTAHKIDRVPEQYCVFFRLKMNP